MHIPNSALKKINFAIVLLIVLCNSYVLLLPLLPNISYWQHKKAVAAVGGIPYKTNDPKDTLNTIRREPPKDNRLVIPAIALDEAVYQGTDPSTVHKGVWARPLTSTPDKGSNTVLVGHRFTYNGPATFYHLDKVIVGDRILIYWNGTAYNYAVTTTKVVPATQVEVEAPTSEDTLTIYTCTPIWSAKDRLVVIAKRQDLKL